jgi:hypothetical protein
LHFAPASFCVLVDIAVFAAAPILCKTSPFYFDLGIPFWACCENLGLGGADRFYSRVSNVDVSQSGQAERQI